MRGAWAMVAALVATAALVAGGEDAAAATLRAHYQFKRDLTSEVAGAPALTAIGRGNRFAIERVDGLGLRHVLRFPRGNGLSLATTGLVDPTNSSVVMLFRLANLHGYRRILDFAGGISDVGLYNLNGTLALYGGGGGGDASPGVVFSEDSYVQVALTTAAAADDAEDVTAYVDGVEVAAATVANGFDLDSGELRFFRDNTSGRYVGEESSGAISCALIYDGTLTADEVSDAADKQALCPAPRGARTKAKASVTGKPKAAESSHSIVVDTGLTVSCPTGPTACAASGRVDPVPGGGPRTAPRGRALGEVRFSVPAGASRRVKVRLRRWGARALRRSGSLSVRVSAEIATAQQGTTRAHQRGRIHAPRPPAFAPGTYTGVTSQNLPIEITVRQTTVRVVYFRWSARCDDGKVHSNAIYLTGSAPVRHGRFSLHGRLGAGKGSARVSGRLKGARAHGSLSRTGASASDAKCPLSGVRWHARVSRLETGAFG